METQAQQARTLLQSAFGQKPTESYILIWTLPEKLSTWFQDLEQAISYATSCSSQDVYVGVGMSPSDNGRTRRCKADNVLGIAGLWADVDILHPLHKKGNLPPDEAAAMSIIDDMGLEPTIVVHSGHGLQAWWLFDEPWIFANAQERKEASILSERWTKLLAEKAKAKGWAVDSTFDLARVMRVPGTTNRKDKDDPKPVEIRKASGARHSRSILQGLTAPRCDAFTPSADRLHGREDSKPPRASQGLVLDAMAQIDIVKFEALCDVEPKFEQSWKRTRKDLHDQTGSSYDLSLATYAVLAAWSDQEIANLILAARRKHNDNPEKALRDDYIARTISKAREVLAKNKVQADQQQALEEIVNSTLPGEAPEQTEENREAITTERIQKLSKALGFEVKRMVKYTADPPIYKMETPNCDVKLGGIESITAQSKFRDRIADSIRVIIPKFKGEIWTALAQLLLNLCEEEELGEDATDTGKAGLWVSEYLRTHSILDSFEDAYDSGAPFVKDGCIHFSGPDMRKWVSLSMGERPSAQQLGAILRTIGAVSVVVTDKIKGEKQSLRAWKLSFSYSLSHLRRSGKV